MFDYSSMLFIETEALNQTQSSLELLALLTCFRDPVSLPFEAGITGTLPRPSGIYLATGDPNSHPSA